MARSLEAEGDARCSCSVGAVRLTRQMHAIHAGIVNTLGSIQEGNEERPLVFARQHQHRGVGQHPEVVID